MSETFSVCAGRRGVDSVLFSVKRLLLELLCLTGGCCPHLSFCLALMLHCPEVVSAFASLKVIVMGVSPG